MRNLGFDGRTFLFEEEWRTYRRRKPVRYIRKPFTHECEVCGHCVERDNPFQNAHRIGFDLGIVHLALTPEFLDGDTNIVTAHRKLCNKKAELDIQGAMKLLMNQGETSLPSFLPEETHAIWQEVADRENA